MYSVLVFLRYSYSCDSMGMQGRQDWQVERIFITLIYM